MFGPMCCGADSPATVEEAKEDQYLSDIEDFVASSIKSLTGVAILYREATTTVSGFTSVQPVTDQHEENLVETQMLASPKRKRQAQKSGTTLPIPEEKFSECCVKRVDTSSHRSGCNP